MIDDKRTIIVHDKRLPQEYITVLKGQIPGSIWHALELEGMPAVYRSIQYHPDIYFFKIKDDLLVHAPCVRKSILDELRNRGVKLRQGRRDPGTAYPESARYNAVRVGKRVFHNMDCTDPVIVEEAERAGLEIIHVPQGYAGCSVLQAGPRAIITADKSIAEAVRGEGIDVLLIGRGAVLLPGEKYGFLGGAGGRMPDGRVVILGDLHRHPDGEKMYGFFREHQIRPVEVEGAPLYDAGSLVILKSDKIKIPE